MNIEDLVAFFEAQGYSMRKAFALAVLEAASFQEESDES